MRTMRTSAHVRPSMVHTPNAMLPTLDLQSPAFQSAGSATSGLIAAMVALDILVRSGAADTYTRQLALVVLAGAGGAWAGPWTGAEELC